MNNNYLDNEKFQYDNIEIPTELDFMVQKTLKSCKNKKQLNMTYKSIGFIACTFLIFVVLVNISPTIAYGMSKIPGLNRLVELVTFDKGFNNALDNGLVKEIDFKEEQNGIKLNVNTITGDWKRLWVEYSINTDMNYELDTKILNKNGNEELSTFIDYSTDISSADRYFQISFEEFIPEFIIQFTITKDKKSMATFNVPISLNSEIFNSPLRNISINNNLIKTNIFDLKILSLKTCKTRTVLEFKSTSDLYDYMHFKNPRLIDNNGTEYPVSPSYISSNNSSENIKLIEFQGEIKDTIKSLSFKYDGIYYARNDNRTITVDLKNKTVFPNDYDIEFVSLLGNELTLQSNNTEGLSFNYIQLDNGNLLVDELGCSSIISNDDHSNPYVRSYFKINNTAIDTFELKIYWILKNKTNGGSLKLIP